MITKKQRERESVSTPDDDAKTLLIHSRGWGKKDANEDACHLIIDAPFQRARRVEATRRRRRRRRLKALPFSRVARP